MFTGTGLISKNYRFTAQQIPIFTGTGLIYTTSIAYPQEQNQSLQPQLQVYSPINSYTYRNGIQGYNPNCRK